MHIICFVSNMLLFLSYTSLLSYKTFIHAEYGAVPVVGVGHSCGSLLHMLITSLFPDTPRAANALISYNNRGVGEAVPFFEELIVPLFSDVDKNGSEFIKAMINVARMQINGMFVYVVYMLCLYVVFICWVCYLVSHLSFLYHVYHLSRLHASITTTIQQARYHQMMHYSIYYDLHQHHSYPKTSRKH